MLYSKKKEVTIMPKTISFHNGTEWSRGHNIRDQRYTAKQIHIDKTLKQQNVTVKDIPVRQAYDEIFGSAVKEYNAKQKRTDRKINNYYEKIKADKRKHPVYECIIQIGDRNDTGNMAKLEKQALIKFAETWEQRNPNLYLIGAYVHADEPDGTVHLHIDYIPVAECTRGMSIQNSLDRALQQQGFHSENIHKTAQIEWQEREREVLANICRSLNINAQHTQGISKGRGHLTKREYIKEKESILQDATEELQTLQQQVKIEQKKLTTLQGKVLKQREVNAIKGKKSLMGALKNVTYEEYLSLKKTAKKIDNITKINQSLEQANKELSAKIELNNNRLEQAKTLLKQHGVQVSNNDLDSLIEKQKYRFDIEDIKKYKPRTLKKENEHNIQKTNHFSID